MYVVITIDEFNKLKESNRKLGLFKDSLNHELKLRLRDIRIAQKTISEDVVNNLIYEYSGMLFIKHIFDITMNDKGGNNNATIK